MKVKNTGMLKELAEKNGGADFFISLSGGLKSSKHISFDGEKFFVLNMIDSTEQELTEKELGTMSNIQEAIDKGAFIYES